MAGPIVSFHPMIEAEVDILYTPQRILSDQEMEVLVQASAVLLPQRCPQELHCLIKSLKKPYFPRPQANLYLDGKVGNAALFTALDLPHPLTMVYGELSQACKAWEEGRLKAIGFNPPLIAKGAGGGEGRNVFMVNTLEELAELENKLDTYCAYGPNGLVIQQYVPCKNQDVRVIFMDQWMDCFWRIGKQGEFRANLSQGGKVDRSKKPELLKKAVNLAQHLRKCVGLDLAAVDILFDKEGNPLLLEINPYFGRTALGGGDRFYSLYLDTVRHWLSDNNLDPAKVRLG